MENKNQIIENTLPSRFQIGDSVRTGKHNGKVYSVTFEEGKISYCISTKIGLVGPVSSYDVHLPLNLIQEA